MEVEAGRSDNGKPISSATWFTDLSIIIEATWASDVQLQIDAFTQFIQSRLRFKQGWGMFTMTTFQTSAH